MGRQHSDAAETLKCGSGLHSSHRPAEEDGRRYWMCPVLCHGEELLFAPEVRGSVEGQKVHAQVHVRERLHLANLRHSSAERWRVLEWDISDQTISRSHICCFHICPHPPPHPFSQNLENHYKLQDTLYSQSFHRIKEKKITAFQCGKEPTMSSIFIPSGKIKI